MNSPSPTTSLWIIFQGDLAKEHVDKLRHTLAKFQNIHFRISSDAPLGQVHPSKPGHRDNAAEPGTILERVLQDCKECAGAIAIVAPTHDDASSRGNLWLEIGLWLALRDVHLLRICHLGKIPAISDINNLPYTVYKDFSELETAIAGHALHVQQHHHARFNEIPDSAYRRVHATFTTPGRSNGAPWLDAQSYLCHRNWDEPHECPFRKQALAFSAELLRMGRANHEQSTISSCLFRIAYSCRTLHHAGSSPPPRGDISARESALRALDRQVRHFSKQIKHLLGGPDREEAYADSMILTPEERFVRFLRDRLEVAKQLDLEQSEIEHNVPIPTLQDASSFLLKHLHLLAEGSQAYRFNGAHKDANYANELWRWGDYCYSIATYLRLLGLAYFDECSEVLRDRLGEAHAPFFHLQLKEIIGALPHNKDKPRHMRIWPIQVPPSIPGEIGHD